MNCHAGLFLSARVLQPVSVHEVVSIVYVIDLQSGMPDAVLRQKKLFQLSSQLMPVAVTPDKYVSSQCRKPRGNRPDMQVVDILDSLNRDHAMAYIA